LWTYTFGPSRCIKLRASFAIHRLLEMSIADEPLFREVHACVNGIENK
jgi:hypothetical protein